MKRVLKCLLAGMVFYAIVTTIAMTVVFIKCLALGVHYAFIPAFFGASRVSLGSALIIAVFTFITLGNAEGHRAR